jgi:hypothetical protein
MSPSSTAMRFPGVWRSAHMRGVWHAVAFIVVPVASSAALFGLLLRSSGAWAVLPIRGDAIPFVLLVNRWHQLTAGPIREGIHSPYALAALSFLAAPIMLLAAAIIVVLLLALASSGSNTL